MHLNLPRIESKQRSRAFTLVELLVVIAIMSILMTAGAIGLGGMGGKGVTSGVATAESLFAEARAIAVGQRTKARVLVAERLTNNPADNLRRIVVVSAEIDPATGREKDPLTWVLSSRGALLPDQTFFSARFSSKDSQSGGIQLDTMTLPASAKASFQGSYFYYEFNAEGICSTGVTSGGSGYRAPSFVVGAGARNLKNANDPPRVTAAGKRDFGGFVVWRNGQTSLYRSPEQIQGGVNNLNSGAQF